MKTFILNYKGEDGKEYFLTLKGESKNEVMKTIKGEVNAENIKRVIEAGEVPTKKEIVRILSEILISDGAKELHNSNKEVFEHYFSGAMEHAMKTLFGISYEEICRETLTMEKENSLIDGKTKVVFLREKDSSDVFAYFPEDKADHRGNFTCYAHIGQHSACHPDYASSCKEAERSEYRGLLIELIGQGYDNLSIINKK
jgi:hypothetical protein